MDGDVTIRPAGPRDFPQAAALLAGSGLPLDGLEERFSHALVASRGEEIVGCVALEIYEDQALLRSLVVAPDERGRRLGERLTSGVLRLAREVGIRDVYLLTETAATFFPRFGFAAEDRSGAPPAIRESVEFRAACPASAVLMHSRVQAA
jgi:N-acetylglutamate synthase-like GNAT family acetyltransferase